MTTSSASLQQNVLTQGLTRFIGLWNQQQGRLVSKRLEGALGRIVYCQSESRTARLVLHRKSAEISEAHENEVPHAVIRMQEADWAKVLTGEWHVMAVILAGRAPFPKDQRRLLMQFSMLLQTTLLGRGGHDD